MSNKKKCAVFFAACIASTVVAGLCKSKVGKGITIGATMGCVNYFLSKKEKGAK